MKRIRINIGTDVAKFGIWDASRNHNPFSESEQKSNIDHSVREAREGQMILIQMGGDCGGQADIYIESEVPNDVRQKMKRLPGDFFMNLPSGELVMDGVEYYRSPKWEVGKEISSKVILPRGIYQTEIYFLKNEDEPPINRDTDTEEVKIQKIAGAKDLEKHKSHSSSNLLVLLSAVVVFIASTILLTILTRKIGISFLAKNALLVAIYPAILIAAYYFRFVIWMLERNPDYKRSQNVANVIAKHRLENDDPLLIVKLKKIDNYEGKMGGIVRVE